MCIFFELYSLLVFIFVIGGGGGGVRLLGVREIGVCFLLCYCGIDFSVF